MFREKIDGMYEITMNFVSRHLFEVWLEGYEKLHQKL